MTTLQTTMQCSDSEYYLSSNLLCMDLSLASVMGLYTCQFVGADV
jgi:hypothetical protein